MATQAFGKRPGAAGRVQRVVETSNGRAAAIAAPSRDVVASGDHEAPGGFSFKYFGCLLFMLLLLAFSVYSTGGALYRDIAHGSDFVADGSIAIDRAECKRTNFILTDCNIDLKWKTASGSHKQNVGFMVLFASMADTAVVPVRSSRAPEVVSTQVALDYMINRIITFVIFASILLTLVVVAFKKTFAGDAPAKE